MEKEGGRGGWWQGGEVGKRIWGDDFLGKGEGRKGEFLWL